MDPFFYHIVALNPGICNNENRISVLKFRMENNNFAKNRNRQMRIGEFAPNLLVSF